MAGLRKTSRVAWIRTGALGDLLVGLAALAEIPTLFPEARVSVVGPKLWLGILSPQAFPFVDEIVTVERRSQRTERFRAEGGVWKSYGEPATLVQMLGGCDAVVNLNIDSYRYGFTAVRAGLRVRLGSAPSPMSALYTHSAPFFGKDPLIHERDAALMVMEYAEPGFKRLLSSTHRHRQKLSEYVEKSRFIAKWRKLGLPQVKIPNSDKVREVVGREPKTYLLVNPTSSRRTNTWPPEKFREFLLQMRLPLSEMGLEPIVIGAPNETDWLQEIAGQDFQVVQTRSLQDLADVVAGAKALVANTSSMQFLAASMQTPVVTLMGRARPEIWGPIGPRDRVVRGTPPPELREDIFRQEEEAYRSIAVESVSSETLTLMKSLR